MAYRFPPKTHERIPSFVNVDVCEEQKKLFEDSILDPVFKPLFEDAVHVEKGLKTNFKPEGKCPVTFTRKEIDKMIKCLEFVIPDDDEYFGYAEIEKVLCLLNKKV